MKRLALALTVVSMSALAQNSSIPLDQRYVMTRAGAEAAKVEAARPQVVATAPAPRTYALPAQSPATMAPTPEWFVRLPEDTAQMMFSAGVGQSPDEQTAYDKARIAAEVKLVELMTSEIRSNTKSFKADTGDAVQERFERSVQKTARGELIGAQRVDSQATFDGRYYKVYMLLRYPLAENNPLRKEREGARAKREAELRAQRGQQELERVHSERQAEADVADQKLKEEIGPKSDSRVVPVVVAPTSEGTVKLLDVDNEEYKKKRDEALQKPGAVVGQITYR